MMRMASIALAACLVCAGFAQAQALELLHVTHTPEMLEPSSGQNVEVRFQLSEPARVTLKLYDARDLLVRSVSSEGALPAGDQGLRWDGKDGQGRPVPPEAYTYTLEAIGGDGQETLWDITDFAGEHLEIDEVSWSPETGRLTYQIPKNARVRVRIGLANDGPLLRTLVDWVPRRLGTSEEPWDGRDASGKLHLGQHPALAFDVAAFELPRNTIFVGKTGPRPAFVELPAGAEARAPQRRLPHRMFDQARRSPAQRRDFPVTVTLPDDLPVNDDGVPVVAAPVPIRIDAGEEDLARMVNERSEAVFYVDGHFVFERETGFLPITWTWDPAGHAPGLHHITTNIRGYDGHFGIGTVPVWVARQTRPTP